MELLQLLLVTFLCVTPALCLPAPEVKAKNESVCFGQKSGVPFVYGTAYLKCELVLGELKPVEMIGCVSPSGGAPIGIGKKDPKTGATCHFDIRSDSLPFLATGDAEECKKRGKSDFVEGNVYKKCVLKNGKFTKEVVACLRELSELEKKKRGKSPTMFSERVEIGETITFTVGRKITTYKCLRVKDTAVIVTEVHDECTLKSANEKFKIGDSLKECVIQNGKQVSKPLACLYPLVATSDLHNKNVKLRHVEKDKTFARIAIGEIFNGEELSKPAVGRCDVIAGEARFNQGDYYTCKGKGDKEFIDDKLAVRCHLEKGVYKAETTGCFVDWKAVEEGVDLKNLILPLGRTITFNTPTGQKGKVACEKMQGKVFLFHTRIV